MDDVTLVEHDLAEITEHLLVDFEGQFSLQTVVEVVRECETRNPSSSPRSLEQAARVRLNFRRQGESLAGF